MLTRSKLFSRFDLGIEALLAFISHVIKVFSHEFVCIMSFICYVWVF